MKTSLLLIVCVLACCLVDGCKKREAASFDQRLAAGVAVMNQTEKNSLMVNLAKDAADAGDPRIVKQALGQIFEDGRRNDTAEACALKLAKAGKRAEALEVAKTIMSQRQQDSVLSKLAK
jgi:predicted negative regulator of RcsB-dependent stress response